MSRLRDVNKGIGDLKEFRHSMHGQLDAQHIFEMWGGSPNVRKVIQDHDIPVKWKGSMASERKLKKAKKELLTIAHVPFIRFVGISGSVAAGIAKENDDIDVFLVCTDHTAWIVRGVVKLLLGNKAVWYGDIDQKDKYCINMIVEERGMQMSEHDIFTFNELVYLEKVYGVLPKSALIRSNSELVSKFGVNTLPTQISTSPLKKMSVLLFPFEIIAFLAQLLYMLVFGHKPEFKRLFKGFLSGKIEFYPSHFRQEKLRDFDISKPTPSVK